MNRDEELPEDSDSSDEEYVPEKQTEDVSEADSDECCPDDLPEDEEGHSNSKKKRTRGRKGSRKKVKKEADVENDGLKQVTEEENKKSVDDIWADFMKDTGFQSRKNNCGSGTVNKINSTPVNNSSNNKSELVKQAAEKVKIRQVFEFAGEEVTVEKEVAVDSAEARFLTESTPGTAKNSKAPSKGLSGISSVLSQLSKKPKISTLEKSKLDWDRFKKEENLEEEIQTHNKGRDGYLEKQDFLQRADLRRFEIEKGIRTIERNKRMNSSL